MPNYVYTILAPNGMMLAFFAKRHAIRFMNNKPGFKYSERYDFDEYNELYED